MSKLHVVWFEIEGSDEVIRQSMGTLAEFVKNNPGAVVIGKTIEEVEKAIKANPCGDVISIPKTAPEPKPEPAPELPKPTGDSVGVAIERTMKKASSGRRMILECREKPGRTFTVHEAAALAKVEDQKVYAVMYYTRNKGLEW